eukprot:s717_g8.t1
MNEYHDNLSEIVLPRHRKSNVNSPLDSHEHRQLRAVLGSLQWLVAQLRFDMSFAVSTLQGENPPTVETVLKANSLVKEFQRTGTFELIFRPVDYRTAGICMVSDAALGNVKLNGATNGTPQEKVYSQACYFALLADEALLSGKEGVFNILDARSHRIPRVCRSTYSAETLAAEEAMDVGQLCRGCLALLNDPTITARDADTASNAIRMTTVVDAKDVHDKSNSDTSTYGTQKSLAFCIAWMRSVLRRPKTALRWTSTENMWVDGGTKQMDLSHMRRIMQAGRWAISYSPEFVKQVVKARSAKPSNASSSTRVDELPGVMLDGNDPLLPHLQGLCEKRGWHHINGVGVQVAHNAKSFRTPEPRFSAEEKPLRSSFGRFTLSDGSVGMDNREAALAWELVPKVDDKLTLARFEHRIGEEFEALLRKIKERYGSNLAMMLEMDDGSLSMDFERFLELCYECQFRGNERRLFEYLEQDEGLFDFERIDEKVAKDLREQKEKEEAKKKEEERRKMQKKREERKAKQSKKKAPAEADPWEEPETQASLQEEELPKPKEAVRPKPPAGLGHLCLAMKPPLVRLKKTSSLPSLRIGVRSQWNDRHHIADHLGNRDMNLIHMLTSVDTQEQEKCMARVRRKIAENPTMDWFEEQLRLEEERNAQIWAPDSDEGEDEEEEALENEHPVEVSHA